MPVLSSSGFPLASDAMTLVRSLLNDADIPATPSTLTATGASRLSNVSTLTATSAHGLVAGDIVQVAGISDATFNGTFTVVSAPTATTFTYNNTGSDGTSGNGYVQRLNQGDVFTDAVLLPFLNSAYRKTQRLLSGSGSPTVTSQIDLLGIAANTLTLDDTSTPQLPSDFIAPQILSERQNSVDTYYIPMVQVGELPERAQGTYNREWSWLGDALFFVGSLVTTDIRIRYTASAYTLSDGTSPIAIRDGIDPVALWCAHLASLSRSSPLAMAFASQFTDAINEVKNTQAHSRQYRTIRRRPYGGGMRR